MPDIGNPHPSADSMCSTHLAHIARKDEISDKDAGGMHSTAQGPQRHISFCMRDAAQGSMAQRAPCYRHLKEDLDRVSEELTWKCIAIVMIRAAACLAPDITVS